MLPLPALFAKPRRGQLKVSPLGRWLAWVARNEAGVLNLWVQRRSPGASGAEAISGRQVTFVDDRDICLLFTFSLDDRYLLYLRETRHASEFYHLYALDLEAEDVWESRRDLIRDPAVTAVVGFVGGVQLWRPPKRPRQVLLATGRGSLAWDVSLLDLDTGEWTVVERNPAATWSGIAGLATQVLWYLAKRVLSFGFWRGRAPGLPVVQWFLDGHHDFEVRGRLEATLFPEFSMSFALRPPGCRSWRVVESIPFPLVNMQLVGASGASGLLHMDFSADGRSLDVHTCVPRDTTSLVRYAVTDDGLQELEVIARDDRCDIDGFLCHPGTGKVQAVAYNYEQKELVPLDDGIAADLQILREAFDGRQMHVTARSVDDTVWVVLVEGDVHPGDYFLYKRSDGRAWHLFAVHPQLQGLPLAPMEPVHVRARDGQDVLCYLSRPLDSEARSAGRLVVYVHGGPSARDYWGYCPQVQLLCSRGMSVLQVNYRASTGFGRHFVQLAYGNVASMQADVEDAVHWAVSKGVADTAKVAILGGSWGGYEALCGMIFSPELYACGVAIVPLSTIGAANTSKAFRGDPLVKKYWDRVYGRAATDRQLAESLSPLYHVSRLQRPLMLVHGELDVRVPREQSDQIAREMQSRGVQGYYVSYADEGHGVKKEPNILDMWSRVERFLCRGLALPDPPELEAKWTVGSSARVIWDGVGLHGESGAISSKL